MNVNTYLRTLKGANLNTELSDTPLPLTGYANSPPVS